MCKKCPEALPTKEALERELLSHKEYTRLIYPDGEEWLLQGIQLYFGDKIGIGYHWTNDPYWGGRTMEVVEMNEERTVAWCDERK